MKKIITVLIAISMSVMFVATALADLNDGLVAHYPFEGNANDVSGQGNNGSEYGGLTYVDGILGQAASFDGVNDYVEVPHDYSLNVNGDSITLSAWIKTSMIVSSPSWGGYIIGKGYDWHHQYSMWVNSSGKVYAIASYYAGGNYLIAESSIPVNDGQWHHIVGVLTDDGADIYVDGILRGTDIIPEYSWNKDDSYSLKIWYSPLYVS